MIVRMRFPFVYQIYSAGLIKMEIALSSERVYIELIIHLVHVCVIKQSKHVVTSVRSRFVKFAVVKKSHLAREICIKLASCFDQRATRKERGRDGFATCSADDAAAAHQLKMIAERRETNLFKPNIKNESRGARGRVIWAEKVPRRGTAASAHGELLITLTRMHSARSNQAVTYTYIMFNAHYRKDYIN